MKDGYIIKSALCGAPKKGEMSLINSYTRRELKDEEVYVFSVVLCDNEVDRDYEVFTVEALNKLSELYVGKTGIIDHDMKSDNQTARIFACSVEKVEGKANVLGEQYYRLVARAYMLRTEKNADFILELDAGIRKEVSVGCSVGSVTCSICGANVRGIGCKHIKGRKYGGNLCHYILENPTDAYEWSFVAVPAQKEAGVIKSFSRGKKSSARNMEEVIKKIKVGDNVELTKEQSRKLNSFISELQKQAEDGKAYRDELRQEVTRLSLMIQPEISSDIMNTVTEKMTICELKEFKKAFSERANKIIPPKPQLATASVETAKYDNSGFKI